MARILDFDDWIVPDFSLFFFIMKTFSKLTIYFGISFR